MSFPDACPRVNMEYAILLSFRVSDGMVIVQVHVLALFYGVYRESQIQSEEMLFKTSHPLLADL